MNEAAEQPRRANPIILVEPVCNQAQSLPVFAQERTFPCNLGNFLEVILWQTGNTYKKKTGKAKVTFPAILLKQEIQGIFSDIVLTANYTSTALLVLRPGVTFGYQDKPLL